jgi:antitoxin (DNA-binding transcriptional repressor) of toxin-antitoxin stability system
MQATMSDLKYKLKEIVQALERREQITLSDRGEVKGTIIPVEQPRRQKVSEHEFFGMLKDDEQSVKILSL